MKIQLPESAQLTLETLEAHGFEAYLVGGSVRDFLLGNTPHDLDITTNAEPQAIMELFQTHKMIATGLKHGTLTVIIDSQPVEITTYRLDGPYSDNRHPDQIQFTKSLKEDLARRDFTMNALAYNETAGIIDFYGGQEDINHKTVRCVGDPEKRFQEDADRKSVV